MERQAQQHHKISAGAVFVVLVAVFSAAKTVWHTFPLVDVGDEEQSMSLGEWLRENDVNDITRRKLADDGVVTLLDYAQLVGGGNSEQQQGILSTLPSRDRDRLLRAARLLRQQIILRQWLAENRLQQHAKRLLQLGVCSLEDVYWLEDASAEAALSAGSGSNNSKEEAMRLWSAARQSLPTSKPDLEVLKAALWSRTQQQQQERNANQGRHQPGKASWSWGGMLVVSVSMAGLLALATMSQPVLAPETKASLLRYVTGKYLLPANCRVKFDWVEPARVGETVTFTVSFYQRNGRPYPICDADNFSVEITSHPGASSSPCSGQKVAVAVDLGAADPHLAHTAAIKFTVRRAGLYSVAVLVGGNHVRGSPFIKSFMPGPPDANKTVLVRHNSTVVCTSKVAHSLYIEPRDEFNNQCIFGPGDGDPVDGYALSAMQIGCIESMLPHAVPIPISLTYDAVMHRIHLKITFDSKGCFRARVSYRGLTLGNGDFDVIVLSSAEAAIVQNNVLSKGGPEVCHEAKLIGAQGERLSKPRRAFVFISPKQLTVKEYLFRLIPKRIATFRLCPSTKFYFPSSLPLSATNSPPSKPIGPLLVVDDGCQPRVELATPDRSIIAATFTHFLLKNIGGSETFKDKQDYFYHEVRKHHHKHHHDRIAIEVQRDALLESSMKATKKFSTADWCKNFEITFQGEQGMDWGGVRREWFELVCSALFDPCKSNLFATCAACRDGVSDSKITSRQALCQPNPRRPLHLKLKYYEFAGKIVGKCLYESALGGAYRQLVRARFTRSFLAQLIGLRVHYKYFEQDDADLYLTKVKYVLDHDLDAEAGNGSGTDLFFAEEEYDQYGKLIKTVELIPGGLKQRVTNQTRHQYLDALAQHRLANAIKEEVDAFLRGLNEIVPDSLLSIFDENELELLMCGTGEYSVSDLRTHHIASGSTPEFRKVLDWFWTAASNFTEEEMARLLQFTTGCSQLPPGGFAELSPKFQVTAAPTYGSLPTAHTCFNQLCLPDYESYEQFEKALLIAINEGTEGFGLV